MISHAGGESLDLRAAAHDDAFAEIMVKLWPIILTQSGCDEVFCLPSKDYLVSFTSVQNTALLKSHPRSRSAATTNTGT